MKTETERPETIKVKLINCEASRERLEEANKELIEASRKNNEMAIIFRMYIGSEGISDKDKRRWQEAIDLHNSAMQKAGVNDRCL